MISKEPECYHRILQNAEVDTPKQDLANLCSEIRCKLPHPNIAAARNEYAQAANIGKKPPVSVALVPNAALVRKRGIFRQSSHRFVIHRSDNAARPRLHLVPGKNPRQHSPAAVRREPCDKVVILGAAEFLGHAHRAPPFRRTRHHAAVLLALQSRHYQNRIRAGAGESVGHLLLHSCLFSKSLKAFLNISSCIVTFKSFSQIPIELVPIDLIFHLFIVVQFTNLPKVNKR